MVSSLSKAMLDFEYCREMHIFNQVCARTRERNSLDKTSWLGLPSQKNDLKKVPSTITFSGNSSKGVWYWMDQQDVEKFYSINSHKISNSDRIQMSDDKESKIIFQMEYR